MQPLEKPRRTSPWHALLAIALGLLLGDRSGGMISYWLVPEIMRLELNWLDYAQKIPRLLQTDFPPGHQEHHPARQTSRAQPSAR